MKLITAIIRPQQLDSVKSALADVGVQGMTVTDIRGFGRQKGHKEIYRGTEYSVDFVPKTKIEIAVAADALDAALNAVTTAAQTGAIGDGKIFVLDLQDVIRVRTGESGVDAL